MQSFPRNTAPSSTVFVFNPLPHPHHSASISISRFILRIGNCRESVQLVRLFHVLAPSKLEQLVLYMAFMQLRINPLFFVLTRELFSSFSSLFKCECVSVDFHCFSSQRTHSRALSQSRFRPDHHAIFARAERQLNETHVAPNAKRSSVLSVLSGHLN